MTNEPTFHDLMSRLEDAIEQHGAEMIKMAAQATGMSENTIRRWLKRESQPQRLDQTTALLEQFLTKRDAASHEEEERKGIAATTYRTICDVLTQKPIDSFSTFGSFSLVLQSLVAQYDPEKKKGIQVTLLQCSNPTSGSVRSLRERFTLNSTYPALISERGVFLGKGTPEAEVCQRQTSALFCQKGAEGHEEDVLLLPLLWSQTSVAGCLRIQSQVSSAPSGTSFENDQTLALFQEYANLCSILMLPHHYAADQLCFEPIPERQNPGEFFQSVARFLAEAAQKGKALSAEEAEHAIWQQREQDLIVKAQQERADAPHKRDR